MSDESDNLKKIEITMTIEELLENGIVIHTGEDVTVTVVDNSGKLSR